VANSIGEQKANLKNKDNTVPLLNDKLFCPEVGKWAEEKHGLVSFYAKLFSTGMKDKWDERVYIELYAGAGYSRIRDTSTVIAGSPIQALMLEHPFDKYIFCEEDPKSLEALKVRVKRTAPSAKVSYVPGDCDHHVDDILAEIPAHSRDHRVLSLCFVDPYDIGIKFETLRRLSIKYVDFLVLLALYMDAARNYDNYVKEKSVKIDEFLGSGDWRERWKMSQQKAVAFPRFLAEEFSRSMETLGYQPQPIYKMKEVKLSEQNVALYRLALFSRHPRAQSLWDQVLKYSTPQTAFNFEKPLGE
jgi:three-Cys-motif partner protein